MSAEQRISLDDVPGDWLTVQEICDWTGAGRNTIYEWCRSGPLRGEVVRFNRAIRVRKSALARLRDGV